MSETEHKTKPRITKDSEEFWAFTREGKLALRECNSCGSILYYPRILCTNCMSTDLGWKEASGYGHIHAFTIIHRAPSAAFRADAPYPLAIVELAEGVRLMSNIIGCDPKAVAIGHPVTLAFEQRDEINIPQFTLSGSAQG